MVAVVGAFALLFWIDSNGLSNDNDVMSKWKAKGVGFGMLSVGWKAAIGIDDNSASRVRMISLKKEIPKAEIEELISDFPSAAMYQFIDVAIKQDIVDLLRSKSINVELILTKHDIALIDAARLAGNSDELTISGEWFDDDIVAELRLPLPARRSIAIIDTKVTKNGYGMLKEGNNGVAVFVKGKYFSSLK